MSIDKLPIQTAASRSWDPIRDLHIEGTASLPPEIDTSEATRRSLRQRAIEIKAGEVALDTAQESGANIPNYTAIKRAIKAQRNSLPQRSSTGRVIIDSLRHRFTS